MGMGLRLTEGEGGWWQSEGRRLVRPKPPPLRDDRLRNGVILCDLFCVLEQAAATQCHLSRYISRRPGSYQDAYKNVQRALWLFRLRKCPPLRSPYLLLPEHILRNDKTVLWGLLWELRTAYPIGDSVSMTARSTGLGEQFDAIASGAAVGKSTTAVAGSELREHGSQAHHVGQDVLSMAYLGTEHDLSRHVTYTKHERRMLDLSLLRWLDTLGVLPTLQTPAAPTLLSYDAQIRDGSILCALTAKILKLGRPLRGEMTRPGSFRDCVANVNTAVVLLMAQKGIGRRFLYGSVERDIVNGDWNAILGLLEDLHIFADGVQPRSVDSLRGQGGNLGPYLGVGVSEDILVSGGPVARGGPSWNKSPPRSTSVPMSADKKGAPVSLSLTAGASTDGMAPDSLVKSPQVPVTDGATAADTAAAASSPVESSSQGSDSVGGGAGVPDLFPSGSNTTASSPEDVIVREPDDGADDSGMSTPRKPVPFPPAVCNTGDSKGISMGKSPIPNGSSSAAGARSDQSLFVGLTPGWVGAINPSAAAVAAVTSPGVPWVASEVDQRLSGSRTALAASPLELRQHEKHASNLSKIREVRDPAATAHRDVSVGGRNEDRGRGRGSGSGRGKSVNRGQKKLFAGSETDTEPDTGGDSSIEVHAPSLVLYRWLGRMNLAHNHYIGSRHGLISRGMGLYLPGGGPLDGAPTTFPGDEPRHRPARDGTEAHWADGVLLCKIVETLERIRGGIAGTTSTPRTRAQATQNVRKALDVLSNSGRFRRGRFNDQEGLETALLEGRRAETVSFLLEIRKVYANRLL